MHGPLISCMKYRKYVKQRYKEDDSLQRVVLPTLPMLTFNGCCPWNIYSPNPREPFDLLSILKMVICRCPPHCQLLIVGE